MESEIVKVLEDITNLYIFPDITKVITMNFGLIMTKEQFKKFREWLIEKGFNEVELKSNPTTPPVLKMLLINLGYAVTYDNRRRGLIYCHTDGKKLVSIIYAEEDVVTIYRVSYFEVG